MNTISTRYLSQCKVNYHNNIRPSKEDTYDEDGHQALIEIAKEFLEKEGANSFSGFFREYQYCVNLWTAHLIIEYGNPNEKLLKKSLEIIIRYSTTPLNKDLAREEKKWLNDYGNTR
ncbi:MAG: hypothetical protein PSN34_04805 [Urechidicola sp.]|nr:hypothetical protein [Urechidicola sp.]